MPGFDFLDKMERYLRTGTYPPDSTKVAKTVIRAASKRFTYKDGCLWRLYRGRLLRVIRNDEGVREILSRYHDDNEHAGQDRMMKMILSLYYWGGVTEAVKRWVKACPACRGRSRGRGSKPPVQLCIAYRCDSSSFSSQELSFHRFPKEAERRRKWLAAAQRDEGSLRSNSCLCSRHFDPACFTLDQEGGLTLTDDAVPTVNPVIQEDEPPDAADEAFLNVIALDELIAASDATEPALEPSDLPVGLWEHQYCLPPPGTESGTFRKARGDGLRKPSAEPQFVTYDQIARYLNHRILPRQSKKNKNSLRRMSKRFGLIDGVLMYTRVSPPVRVLRSREEVNSILKQFHDDQGHYGQGVCQRAVGKLFYWATMSRDLARWISNCHTCLSRTQRKWLRCSVYNCTNCCGPVERGLGLTFHKFPLHNPALLARWLKNVGRSSWHPRLRSSVCSAHFTDDCFDRGGEKVTLRPDAVPSVFVYRDPGAQSRPWTQLAAVEEVSTQEQIYFAKYDAAERYIRTAVYPPGLNYVEKNTFRRFCKKFTIKDDQLHVVRGDRVRLVLRSRQEVEAAMVDYHNELNHLDLNKCLRLLNERFFWKTMRPDVIRWIDSCSHCCRTRKKKPENQTEPESEPEGPETLLEAVGSPQIHLDLDSGNNEDNDDDDEDDVSGDDGDEDGQPAMHSRDTTPSAPISPVITRVWSVRRVSAQSVNPPLTQVQRETSSSQPQNQSDVQFEIVSQQEVQAQSEVQIEASGSQVQPQDPSSTRAQRRIHFQVVTKPPSEPQPQTELPEKPRPQTRQKSKVQKDTSGPQVPPPNQNGGSQLLSRPQTQTLKQTPTSRRAQRPAKRKRNPETDSPAKRTSSCGMEPVAVPSSKPWPVFTVTGSAHTQPLKPTPEVDSPPPCARPGRLQARTVVQQCCEAKVKVRPALDGADAQWAEIQQGMVVYVCFFHGASKELVQQMADTLLNAKLFRNAAKRPASILDLPGSVLFIPQDSLLGEPVAGRRMRYKGGCERWRGARLYANLVSACREVVAASEKCGEAGVAVEQGIYGQKQEIVLKSLEPLTHLLEF